MGEQQPHGIDQMSSLTNVDKRYLKKVLVMGSGYVLDFSDATFGQFFNSYSVDIHGARYQTYGTSKANKMRAFWDTESDELVGRVLSEMLDICEGTLIRHYLVWQHSGGDSPWCGAEGSE